ncbi:thiol:disulfide interchange protein dsbE-like protein [Octadecabacter antarcticus 307]|uniref:Thiol:disulfide interchange protein dsbE-like protein n=1 Tax=Octadecabacter antarcticus 307 TaxID=391626 RepID=M9R7R1_9RHOB|nr:DsbE family thiol:disulfide interchange protein [Octadecabacter antarcticus]AGI67803.1 thiol:disulfide interchange protein dsbE-like protein [Octadecabacter antarcticus 307]
MSKLMMVPVVLFAALAGLFAAGMYSSQGPELPSAFIGRPAPAIDVSDIVGLAPLTDAMLRDGEVKIVNFWASWCAPCRVEHPSLTALADEGVPIYGINYKDLDRNALSFLGELGDPYLAVGSDPRGFHAIDWGVYGVPETFLIDGDGTILLRMAAPVTQRELANRLRPALDAARAAN